MIYGGDDFRDLRYFPAKYFGFVKCQVKPPDQLMFPILPSRINNKLIFPLCRTCAETNSTQFCNHTDDERNITGTFTTVELDEAISYGYEVTKVYQILDYDQVSRTLFDEYINKFIKEKFHASGFPPWVKTEQDKLKFIEDIKARQKIELDIESIEKNPVKRMISKYMLNSFYGKFGERPNMPTVELIRDPAKHWDLITRSDVEILSQAAVNDDPDYPRILINYKKKEESDCSQGQANVAVAALCTAYGRLKLFRLLNRLEERSPGCVLYYDTDSVFFVQKPNTDPEPTGDLLGELTDELDGKKCYKAVFLGPKSYGYEVTNPDGSTSATIKAKGVSLTAKALEVINFDEMKRLALEYAETRESSVLQVDQQRIASYTSHQLVMTKEFRKNYRALSEKRMVQGNDSFPFGWKLN